MGKRFVTSVVYYATSGMLMLSSDFMVLSSAVLRILSTSSSLWSTLALGGVSWRSSVCNDVMRVVHGSPAGIAWKGLRYRLAILVESNDIELQTLPRWVEKDCRWLEELSKTKEDWNRLTVENKVVHALERETSELMTTSSSLVGSLHEIKARTVQTGRDLK